jgi:hypothetical protein
VTDFLRDALLATASGVALLAGLALTESLALLADPTAAAAGVVVALLVEAAFVAGTPAGRLWERPLVRRLAVAAFVVGAVAIARVGDPRVFAAGLWGIATYFALLFLVLTGVWNPGESR